MEMETPQIWVDRQEHELVPQDSEEIYLGLEPTSRQQATAWQRAQGHEDSQIVQCSMQSLSARC